MKMLRGFLLGAVLVAAAGAFAAPPILAAFSMQACTVGSNTALSAASEVVFAANASRKSVTITNNDASIAIFVKLGATATADNLRVPAGSTYTLEPVGGYIWTGTIDAIAASGTPDISSEECY